MTDKQRGRAGKGEPPPRARPVHHAHITRRSFLAGGAVIAAGAGVAALVGWQRRDAASNRVAGIASTPTMPPAIEPVANRGGTLRAYNFDAAPYDSLDPHHTQGEPISHLHDAVFSRLLRVDPITGVITPDLAAAMPEQPDSTTLVIAIRDGVRFHDSPGGRRSYPQAAGRALTSDDVQQSIDRQRDGMSPQRRRFFRRDMWDVIDRIETPDSRTVVIKTHEPVAPMLAFLASAQAFVIPVEVLERNDAIVSADGLIGTGPFMLDDLQDGSKVRLARNPAWFAADDSPSGPGRPFVSAYEAFLSPQEDAFSRAAFERRIVDVTGFVDQAELVRAHTTNLDDISLLEEYAPVVLGMRLLLDRPPFQDERARRAIHLAIDRHAIIEAMYPTVDGRPSARLSGPVPPAVRAWVRAQEDLEREDGYRTAQRDADIAEARGLWNAAMGNAPIDLRVTYAGIPRTIPERAMEVVRASLQGVLGVNVVADVDPTGQVLIRNAYLRNLEGATEGAVTCAFGFDSGGHDLDEWVYGQFRSTGAMNTYRLQDAQLDTLLDAQRREFDVEARREIGVQIQEYLVANVNARLEICAPVARALSWGYVRNAALPWWRGELSSLADAWLDDTHPAFPARPA